MNRKVFMIALCALTMSMACFGSDGKDNDGSGGNGGSGGGGTLRIRTALTGPAIRHEVPSGHADFRSEPAKKRTDFTVEVEDVNLPDGTVLTVAVIDNGTSTTVGTIKLLGHSSELELRSQDGDVVPQIQKGDMVVVSSGAHAILSGVF